MKKLIQQFLKFGVVGGIAFLIDAGIMMILSSKYIGMPIAVANVISFTVSVIFNYIASMAFVFESRDDISKKKEFTIFMILSIIGLVINTVIVSGLLDGVFASMKDSAYYPYIKIGVKVVATAIVTVYNFITRKIFLEKKEA